MESVSAVIRERESIVREPIAEKRNMREKPLESIYTYLVCAYNMCNARFTNIYSTVYSIVLRKIVILSNSVSILY